MGESGLSGGQPASFFALPEVTGLHVCVLSGCWLVARRGVLVWELLGHVSAMWPHPSA